QKPYRLGADTKGNRSIKTLTQTSEKKREQAPRTPNASRSRRVPKFPKRLECARLAGAFIRSGKRALLLALCLPIVSAINFAAGAEQHPAAHDGRLDAAFRLVHEAVEKGEVPGAIALVARDGKILRQEAYGLRDIENQLPFTTNTLCWIASITKPVTVAAAMTLVDVGKLALDDAIEKYLPEFREQTDTNGTHHVFTIRQLMSHTSGLVPNPPTRRSGWPIGGPLDDFWLQQIFSHGWELPARLTGEGGRNGAGIPADAHAKPGSGGQY